MGIKYKARYRKKDSNPFSQLPNIVSKVADISEEISLKEAEEMAKEGAPKGYEFIEVKRVEK